MSSVFLGQKNHLKFNKVYPYLSLLPASKPKTSTIFCISAIEEHSLDYTRAVLKVGKNYPETSPVIQSSGSERESNVNISAYSSFIQHLSEIRYLAQQEPLKSIPAVNITALTESKPSGVPQISAEERMRLLDDYLGSPSSSFLPRWEKERMRVKDQGTDQSNTITSSSGSLVREVGSITINNGKTKPNHDD